MDGDYDDEMRRVVHAVAASQRREVKRLLANKVMLSSPNLQMLLYFNFFYSLAYTWFFLLSYRWKYLNHSGLRVEVVTPALFCVWVVAEIARIHSGYQGNLKEDTPSMAAFIFLTLFPQLIITIYMMAMQSPLFGFDRIFGWIMLIFLVVEFLLSWKRIGIFIEDKTARFSVEYGEASRDDRSAAQLESMPLQTDEGMDVGYEEEEYGTIAGDRSGGTVEMMSTRGTRAGTRRAAEANEPIASREGTLRSFGGPSAQPLSVTMPPPSTRRSAPRGSGAPPMSSTSATAAAAGPVTSPTSGTPLTSGLLSTRSATIGGLSSTSRDGGESAEERARRRARDRAIISGQIQIPRRRDEEEEELERMRAQMMAESQDRMAVSSRGPVLTHLTSPPAAAVRIPSRAELQASSTRASQRNETKTE